MGKSRSIMAVLCIFAAPQANALSCMEPDPARTYQQLSAAEDRYVVLLGRFEFEPPPMPPFTRDPQGQDVTATFTGTGLGVTGFRQIDARSVTLSTQCFSAWCGGFPTPGEDILAFVAVTETGQTLTLGPCGGRVFEAQTAPIVEACMRGDGCDP